MDPSCTLGFYCRDKADFEMFCAQVIWDVWSIEEIHTIAKKDVISLFLRIYEYFTFTRDPLEVL